MIVRVSGAGSGVKVWEFGLLIVQGSACGQDDDDDFDADAGDIEEDTCARKTACWEGKLNMKLNIVMSCLLSLSLPLAYFPAFSSASA